MHELLVATANKLLLIRDGTSQELLSCNCYGITWDKDTLYLGTQGRPEILIWMGESAISKSQSVPFPYRIDDAHQILYYEGILYVTNTGHNRIDAWNGETSATYQWAPTMQDGKQAPDHINSIWCDGNNFYVCEHRYGVRPAKIQVFDLAFNMLNTLEFYDLDTSHACGIHNVYVEDDILYTLSVNTLIKRCWATDKIQYRDIRYTKDIGYLRGLARNTDYFYIGESNVCVHEDRRKGDSAILILDNDFQMVDVIKLADTGQLHEIRLLNGDKAHNGLSCPCIW